MILYLLYNVLYTVKTLNIKNLHTYIHTLLHSFPLGPLPPYLIFIYVIHLYTQYAF